MKRFFDMTAALVGLVVLGPLFLIIAVLILVTMGRPVLFRQARVGRNERPFTIIKFRSMVRNADRQGPEFTTGGDARITPLGRFLRRTKLDELPQLVNILKGEMSFVGPRPEVARYVKLYNADQRRVLTVRPGLTDPASLAYHNEEEILARFTDTEKGYVEKIMPAKLELNLAYLEKAGLLRDLGLIFKTIGRLFCRR